jgi:hypothetical protein
MYPESCTKHKKFAKKHSVYSTVTHCLITAINTPCLVVSLPVNTIISISIGAHIYNNTDMHITRATVQLVTHTDSSQRYDKGLTHAVFQLSSDWSPLHTFFKSRLHLSPGYARLQVFRFFRHLDTCACMNTIPYQHQLLSYVCL